MLAQHPSSTPSHRDSNLVRRWQAGDNTAAVALVRRQVEPLRRFFRVRVPCTADAEDLVQRTLTVSMEALPRFRGEGSFSGFTRTIAVRLLLHYRYRGQRASVRSVAELQPDELVSEDTSPLIRSSREDTMLRLHRAMAQLPDPSARLLWLRYWEGESTEDIGRLLEIRPTTVRVRLHRARRELREVLLRSPTLRPASASDVWPIGGL